MEAVPPEVAKAITAEARAFVRSYLAECCDDLSLIDEGRPRGSGRLSQLEAIVAPIGGEGAGDLARALVEKEAVRACRSMAVIAQQRRLGTPARWAKLARRQARETTDPARVEELTAHANRYSFLDDLLSHLGHVSPDELQALRSFFNLRPYPGEPDQIGMLIQAVLERSRGEYYCVQSTDGPRPAASLAIARALERSTKAAGQPAVVTEWPEGHGSHLAALIRETAAVNHFLETAPMEMEHSRE